MINANIDRIISSVINENLSKLLTEYYIQISNPKLDSAYLVGIQIQIYSNDRENFTPHCHIISSDNSTEFEVSIIDWNIINIKRGDSGKVNQIYRKFSTWLYKIAKNNSKINKFRLYNSWDKQNANNSILSFLEKHELSKVDNDLIEYIKQISNSNNNDIKKSNLSLLRLAKINMKTLYLYQIINLMKKY